MPKYQKKPDVVEAFQMTKERRLDNSEWPEWLNKAWQKGVIDIGGLFCSPDGSLESDEYTPLFLQTLTGTHKVDWDDFIILNTKGELRLCNPDVFKASYKLIPQQSKKGE